MDDDDFDSEFYDTPTAHALLEEAMCEMAHVGTDFPVGAQSEALGDERREILDPLGGSRAVAIAAGTVLPQIAGSFRDHTRSGVLLTTADLMRAVFLHAFLLGVRAQRIDERRRTPLTPPDSKET